MIVDRYSGIKHAALVIAYDNNLINRYESEEDFLSALDEVLGAEGVYEEDLRTLDRFILTLTDDEVETLCAGEQSDQTEIAQRCEKPEVCGLLDDIFNHETGRRE